jgi:hypothetical protein
MKVNTHKSFDTIEKYAQFLFAFIEIYGKNTSLDINTFETQEIEYLKTEIIRFKGEDSDF